MENLLVAVEPTTEVEAHDFLDQEQLIKQLSDAQLAYVGGGLAHLSFV